MNFQGFRNCIIKYRKIHQTTVKGVKAKWPYNYNDNIGYEVTMKGVKTYWYFNDEGRCLVSEQVREIK